MSKLGIARADIERYAMAAQVQTNWMPRVLGSMMLRVGLQYIAQTLNNVISYSLPFVFALNDTAKLEFTDSQLRVFVNDALITRAAVTAAVTNGTFPTNLTGWTNSDESGASSTWSAPNYMSLVGTGPNSAIRDQQVTVNQPNVEHALRIVIPRGNVTFLVGNSQGTDELVTKTILGTGTHSIAFTPAGASFWIRFQNANIPAALVSQCTIEAAGVLQLPTPYTAALLRYIRNAQSADVIYLSCVGVQQRKIERRSTTSWSVVLYEPPDGPFGLINTSAITIAASAISGDITLTASKSIFRSTHVGALFRIASTGQFVQASVTGADQWTNPVMVIGVGSQRTFTYSVTGVFTATVTLQYSVGAPGSWVDVGPVSGVNTRADGQDNQIIYYRIGVKAGDYTSGTAVVSISFASGSIKGIVKITAYSSGTSVSARVLVALGGTASSSNWWEGQWSDYRGWPSVGMFFEGRLWWMGKNKMNGSVSDAYESFDDTVIGDSGPVSRSIGQGPVDSITWALPLMQLELGTSQTEYSVRSSTFSGPITPTNFYMHPVGTQGSANVDAVKIDNKGVFVQRGGSRLFELDLNVYTSDYGSNDLSIMVPDLNDAGIVKIAVQRQPDTRIHCVRADGTAGVMIYDRGENVMCWIELETPGAGGLIEDVCVLPGTVEDSVYYEVQRTINGSAIRCHEKFALESQCQGLPEARLADSHVMFTSVTETTTITGLSHLEGQTVVGWGWNTIHPFVDGNGNTAGFDLGQHVVSGGQITLIPSAVTNACVGLAYTAQFESMKEGIKNALGNSFNDINRIDRVGFVLLNSHGQTLMVGTDFDHLQPAVPQDDLPLLADGVTPDLNAMFVDYDFPLSAIDDVLNPDTRICLEAAAPRPCTVVACTLSLTV